MIPSRSTLIVSTNSFCFNLLHLFLSHPTICLLHTENTVWRLSMPNVRGSLKTKTWSSKGWFSVCTCAPNVQGTRRKGKKKKIYCSPCVLADVSCVSCEVSPETFLTVLVYVKHCCWHAVNTFIQLQPSLNCLPPFWTPHQGQVWPRAGHGHTSG